MLLLIIITWFTHASATDSLRLKKVVYKVKITTASGQRISGYLNNIDDNSIFVTQLVKPYGKLVPATGKRQINFDTIATIKIGRKNRVAKGLLFGLLGGGISGAIIGGATYKKPDCGPGDWFCPDFGPGFSILGGAVSGMTVGSITGTLIGAFSRKTFIIKGNKEKFEQMKTFILNKVTIAR